MANEKRNRPMSEKKGKGISFRHQIENQDRLSVIISVQQDEKTIRKLIKQVERLVPKEILIIIDGSQDQSVDLILNSSSYARTCYIYSFPLGEELWRSIGAKEATGDVWLFLDGDTVISAEELMSFVGACYRGIDIALRKESPLTQAGTISLAKAFMNSLIDQEQLGVSSMSDLPLAMTQKAALRIGLDHLVTPPLAHVIAIEKGLRVEAVNRTKEEGLAKQRISNSHSWIKESTCLGDHLEAVAYWSDLNKTDREMENR
ncbi:glycosyltransferase [Brevibacillus choshinensis]|uniref:glycosyltransferase n=2 Tax=Brevibacillus choshinensis TaxID=54911 RepID=UPI002E2280E2|nr:glycosyltransferase [Brevibacillus choshinensis]